jgi:hypothetical protein
MIDINMLGCKQRSVDKHTERYGQEFRIMKPLCSLAARYLTFTPQNESALRNWRCRRNRGRNVLDSIRYA